MADTNEAQLLSDLLRDIAREDARVDAPHLEARVMEAVEASAFARAVQPGFGATRSFWAIAAAVAVAVLVPTMFWLKVEAPVEKAQLVHTTEEVIGQTNPEAGHYVLPPTRRSAKSAVTRSAPVSAPPIAKSSVAPITQSPIAPIAQSPVSPIAQSPITQSRDEFIPLMPMTEQELTGPFQIVRVQMPRASLGALQSPLEHPNELVEADVLLGEDGMARAIRVSTSGSVYPWRSR